jgi:predicted RNase H-like HicB family nuclease
MYTNYEFTIRMEYTPDGYLVTVPALPGCFTWGETVEEAQAMAKDSILAYLESLAADNEPIPIDMSQVDRVTVSLSS